LSPPLPSALQENWPIPKQHLVTLLRRPFINLIAVCSLIFLELSEIRSVFWVLQADSVIGQSVLSFMSLTGPACGVWRFATMQ
jgi:hypothetical protein